MKLLIGCVPYDHGKSGISVYMRQVIQTLQKEGHDITLILNDEERSDFSEFPAILIPPWAKRPIFNMFYHLFLLPWRIPKRTFDRLLLLAGNRRMTAFHRGPSIAVVHDLSQYHVPAKYDLFRMIYIKRLLPFFVRRNADLVIAISHSTERDLIRFWKIPAGKISVCYNGIDRTRLPLGENDASAREIVYISRIEAPGKNHEKLIKAWEILPETITRQYKLILIGADWTGAEEIHRQAENSPKKDSIVFTGFVTQEQLAEHYRHCSLLVFPSLFEGFGLGLAEAMACGVVCACSNNSSLGEIGRDGAAELFDPQSPDSIANAVQRALTHPQLRRELRQKGLERAAEFSWESHVRQMTAPFHGNSELFGIRFFAGGMSAALDELDRTMKLKKQFCCFVNADCFNQAFRHPDYAGILKQADHVWADGIGVAWAAAHRHNPVHGNVNGTDMLPELCKRSYRLFLLGGRPGVAEKAGENLKKQYHAQIAGTMHGYFDKSETEQVLESIRRASPDILLVAFGVPAQERWIAEHLEKLECKAVMGVGGLLDFASGRIPRAPQWMRSARIEWVFRLIQEPRRLFKRYVLGNPLFILRVIFSRRHF